jgi:hypothetical protein
MRCDASHSHTIIGFMPKADMTPQEYACRYLYVAGRERSNVGDQKIAVF